MIEIPLGISSPEKSHLLLLPLILAKFRYWQDNKTF